MVYRNKRIERCAFLFLNKLPKQLLKFPIEIATSLKTVTNCTVHSYQTFAKRHKTSLDEVIAYCESDTGCTHNQGDKYIIMFNDAQTIIQERKVFTLAHELGHILLGHFIGELNLQIAQNSIVNKSFEREANHFAACLLCPTPIIHHLKLKSVADIQKTFGLSYEAAEIAWNDYKNYDRNYNISWHNDMIRLFFK